MIAQQEALISELQQATKYTGFMSAGLVGNCSQVLRILGWALTIYRWCYTPVRKSGEQWLCV